MTDLRDVLRALRAAPVVSAAAVLSLALGIGANTAIFSLVDRVLLRSLPVSQPERLVMLTDRSSANPIRERIRGRADDLLYGAFAWSEGRFDLPAGGQVDVVAGVENGSIACCAEPTRVHHG